jgi:4-alpha-glucanotransferase
MGFWQGNDIADRVDLKLLNEAQGEIERRYRAAQREALIAFLREEILLGDDLSEFAILKGWLSYLAQQHEEFLLINLEDLWLESAAQNVPGTWHERPNWQRKARYSLDALERLENVNNFLSAIRDIRERIR